jgi:tetratricopeptide (TPR) repeat protein
MRVARIVAGSMLVLLSTTLAAIPAPVDVENVPVARVVANLERQVGERPNDADLRVNLARVHAMAYAEKVTTIPSATVRGGSITIVPYVGGLVPEFRPFEVKPSTDPKVTAIAREHLTKAIARYREALEIAPSNQIAKLGLGWTLIQTGDTAEAIRTLRELVAQSQAKDQRDPFVVAGFRSLTEEAIRYLVPLLDPMRDRAEIDRLRATEKELSLILRPVTPIVVPVADGISAQDIVDPHASVAFDLDGSALPRRWTWIRPTAAWLVFDKHGRGSITSGLQLFGSVTFWMFWRQGYDALRSLDDDGDGQIAGTELTGLALWHDQNSDGRSDRGEVRSVRVWDIVALSCQYGHDASHPHEIAMSPRGVTFRNGTTRPTFDLVLHPASR